MQLILSYFDKLIGPSIFYSVPEEIPVEYKEMIVSMMDIKYNNACFGFLPEKKINIRLLNYVFHIPSKWARGRKEILMLTGIFDRKLELDFIQHKIEEIAKLIQSNNDIFKALYIRERNSEVCEEHNLKLKKILMNGRDIIELKIKQMYNIDGIFSQEPLDRDSESAIVLKSLARTFITCIDAQVPEGAILLYDTGSMLAEKFYKLFNSEELDVLLGEIANFWKKHAFGEIDDVSFQSEEVKFHVYDCFECSHMENIGKTICKFDEGFLTTLLHKKLGKRFHVQEVDCYATGSSYCNFIVKPISNK